MNNDNVLEKIETKGKLYITSEEAFDMSRIYNEESCLSFVAGGHIDVKIERGKHRITYLTSSCK